MLSFIMSWLRLTYSGAVLIQAPLGTARKCAQAKQTRQAWEGNHQSCDNDSHRFYLSLPIINPPLNWKIIAVHLKHSYLSNSI